jgi:hypothetical protein
MSKVNNCLNEAYNHFTDPVFARYTQELEKQIDILEHKNSSIQSIKSKVDSKDCGHGYSSLLNTRVKVGKCSYIPKEEELDELDFLLELAVNHNEELSTQSIKYENQERMKEKYDVTMAFLKKYEYNIV